MNDLAALYLKQHKEASSEPLLREALSAYRGTNASTWTRYRCESLLGASLSAQKRYAEGEPLLLSGYEGLLKQQHTMPWERRDALKACAQWIVRLYDRSGRPEKAAKWRQEAQHLNVTALREH